MNGGDDARAWAKQRRGLYAIIDPSQCRGRDPVWIAECVLDAGCAVLQLRAKSLPAGQLEALARTLQTRCRDAGVPFVVNDSVELAHRIAADGVHLGQTDLAIETARTQLTARTAIGLSTHDLAQARDAEARGAALIGFGPVFPTRSKLDPDPVVGLAALQAVVRAVSLPVVAIGGITPDNVADVVVTGASMAAAIGALCAADDPTLAARRLHLAFTR